MAVVARAVVRGEEVRSEETRLEYQAAKSKRRDFLVKPLGNAPDCVFGCAINSGSSRTPVGRAPAGSSLIFLSFLCVGD